MNAIAQNQTMSQQKILLCGIGLVCLIANSLVLYISFLWAYFSNNYVFSARINDFGEAHFEFVLLPVTLVLGVYAVINLFRHVPKKNNK